MAAPRTTARSHRTVPGRRGVLREWGRLPRAMRLLVLTQLAFNIDFFMAVPYLAFLLVVAALLLPAAPGPAGLWSAVGFVALLTTGQMIAGPIAQDLVPRLAGERRLGAHFGLPSSAGGLAVLVGSTARAPCSTPRWPRRSSPGPCWPPCRWPASS